ncbi:MAG TPA: hypothetical protein VHX42_03900 [Candidatus Babeliales bacterium]|nr:hypothetical protein [Candidatus Babeliales bacterium]
MHTYNFFFFAMIMGICWAQNSDTMELSKRNSDKKNNVILDMHRFWSDDYRENISKTKNLDLKSMRWSLKKEQCLPSHANGLDHLLYLSTIKNSNTKTLFTQKQQNKFDTAEKIKRSVPWFFGINGAVIAGTALFPFTNFVSLSQCSNVTVFECLSQTTTITISTVISVGGALAVGFVSLYATGLSPDLSSRKADKVQDEIGHLKDKYATISKYLIDIYFENPEQAQWIANKFDIAELTLRAQQKTHKSKAGKSLVSPLEEALHFIKYGNVLVTFTEIENYLYNKRNHSRIELLEKQNEISEKRIESLEKIIHEQYAEIEKLKEEI